VHRVPSACHRGSPPQCPAPVVRDARSSSGCESHHSSKVTVRAHRSDTDLTRSDRRTSSPLSGGSNMRYRCPGSDRVIVPNPAFESTVPGP
jgi:hypothetical protein